jgi:hypothetical protein
LLSTAADSAFDVESFIREYYDAWSGTDLDGIMSYYADDVVLQIPGLLMEGKEAVRDQFARPFTTAFPHFTQKYARKMNKQIDTIPESTIRKLQRCFWPGNVRELENLIERSVILTCNTTLSVSSPDNMNSAIDAAAIVGDFEEQKRIVETLRETKGRISGPNGAAFRLGMKRSTLLDRMKKLGIKAREVKSSLASETQVIY